MKLSQIPEKTFKRCAVDQKYEIKYCPQCARRTMKEPRLDEAWASPKRKRPAFAGRPVEA
jgi:hypothetical protein